MNIPQIPGLNVRASGLFAFIESKRMILPLKGLECDFSVISGLVEVSMTQIFRQENDRALDCEYQFPLPADASVFACEADINGRVIRAQVRERAEARKIAAEKKAAGSRTLLVESERDNLFTLSLGNVQPEDLIVIRLKYFQPVRSSGDTRSVEVPFCPGVRYIPGKALLRGNRGKGVADDTDEVPDASKISPVRIDAGHPDAAYIEVRGTLDGRFLLENSLSSPSHPIAIHPVGNELRIALSDKGDVPDRDFVLRWTERETEAVASRVWVRQNGPESYALMEVRAPKTTSGERAAIDFYFLVDRSGSMQGEKWNKAAEALQSCLRVLGPDDRAMVTFFETGFRDFAEGPLPVQDLLRNPQFQAIQRLGAIGGTQMKPALVHVLEIAARHSKGRDKNLILITDAQVGNESGILELMKKAPDLPVHCFGIDIALNDSLLLALCRQQGGTIHSLHPGDDIQKMVSSLGQMLGCPVLLDLKLSEGWEPADAKIPNLYAGQIHYLSARSSNGNALGLVARTASAETVKINFEAQPVPGEAPYLHWCRSRMRRLIAEGDGKSAVALSVQSNLICPLTAFIAWDESEKTVVANQELVQPSMELDKSRLFASGISVAGAGMVKSNALCMTHHFMNPDRQANHAVDPKINVNLDELSVQFKLWKLCQQISVADYENLLKAIFDWVSQGIDEERLQRILEVKNLFREITTPSQNLAVLVGSTALESLDATRSRIQTSLTSFIKKHNIRTENPS